MSSPDLQAPPSPQTPGERLAQELLQLEAIKVSDVEQAVQLLQGMWNFCDEAHQKENVKPLKREMRQWSAALSVVEALAKAHKRHVEQR